MPGFTQSSGSPSAQFPQSSFFPSVSLQPLGSNSQPSHTTLITGSEVVPSSVATTSLWLCFSSQAHTCPPSALFLDQCKVHSRIKLKLMLVWKKTEVPEMHIEGQGGYVPQTSTEAETAPLISGDLACHPAPSPSSTSSPSPLLKPTGPTFTVPCTQGTEQAFLQVQCWSHHKYTQHSTSVSLCSKEELKSLLRIWKHVEMDISEQQPQEEKRGLRAEWLLHPFLHISKHSCKVHQQGEFLHLFPTSRQRIPGWIQTLYASVTKLKS